MIIIIVHLFYIEQTIIEYAIDIEKEQNHDK